MSDDAVRAVLARQLADAIEAIRQLLDLLDRKWLQVSWRESDLRLVEEARAFVRDNSPS